MKQFHIIRDKPEPEWLKCGSLGEADPVFMALLLGVFLLLTGCANTMQVLEGADAACADIEVDGYLTDSRARGRILKLPEGQELTPELAETLCQ